jgi:DNA-binding transcriptional LysR family regulator
MDYRYLKAFLLTARHQSFSLAAKELRIAQSAVSRQIKLLEEDLGGELLIRSSKKVILTKQGLDFFQMLERFDQSARSILEQEEKRPLKIGVLQGLLEIWLCPILVKYSKKTIRDINVSVGIPDELKMGVIEGKFDVVFSTENIQSDIISSKKLFNEKLVLIAKKEVNLKKLELERWIVYNRFDNIYKLCKKTPVSTITMDSIPSIVNLVKNGAGIAVVPDHTLKRNDGLVIHELPDLTQSEIYMTTLNFKVMPQSLKDFIEHIGP